METIAPGFIQPLQNLSLCSKDIEINISVENGFSEAFMLVNRKIVNVMWVQVMSNISLSESTRSRLRLHNMSSCISKQEFLGHKSA